MTTHVEARQIVLETWPRVIPTRPPTLAEICAVQYVACHETGYGAGWHSPPHAPDANGSNNWGSVQCTEHWKEHYQQIGQGPRPDLSDHSVPSAVAGHCFLAVDSTPKNGTSWYAGPYRIYTDPHDGCAAVMSLLERRGVLQVAREQRTIWAVAAEMFKKGYYQGFHENDPQANITDYTRALTGAGQKISAALGEPWGLSPSSTPAPVGGVGGPPTPFPHNPPPCEPSPPPPCPGSPGGVPDRASVLAHLTRASESLAQVASDLALARRLLGVAP